MDKKQRFMTKQEKENFLSRVKIQAEDVPKSTDPKDIFKQNLMNYQEQMKKQIEDIKNLIAVQENIKSYVETLLDKDSGLNIDTLKSEIATKDEVLAQARCSLLMMEEKLKIGDANIDNWVKEYDMFSDIDIYFGSPLRLPTTEERIKGIIRNDKK